MKHKEKNWYKELDLDEDTLQVYPMDDLDEIEFTSLSDLEESIMYKGYKDEDY